MFPVHELIAKSSVTKGPNVKEKCGFHKLLVHQGLPKWSPVGNSSKCRQFTLLGKPYSPNGRFLVQETFPKTLPRFVCRDGSTECATKPSILCHRIWLVPNSLPTNMKPTNIKALRWLAYFTRPPRCCYLWRVTEIIGNRRREEYRVTSPLCSGE